MSNFDTAVNRVLGTEGGYVNNPKDTGGETNWGITKRLALQYGYTGAMKDMSRTQAIMIYKPAFWDAVKGDQMPLALAFQAFDAAVNHGEARAVRFLQASVLVPQDGNIGPVTIAAANAAKLLPAVIRFNNARILFYTAFPKDQWLEFGEGWMNRVVKNQAFGLTDCP